MSLGAFPFATPGFLGPTRGFLCSCYPLGSFWLAVRFRGAAYGVRFALAIVAWPVPGVLRFSFGLASPFVRWGFPPPAPWPLPPCACGGLASTGCLAVWRRRSPCVAVPLRCVAVVGFSRSYPLVGTPLSLNRPRGPAVKCRPFVLVGPRF